MTRRRFLLLVIAAVPTTVAVVAAILFLTAQYRWAAALLSLLVAALLLLLMDLRQRAGAIGHMLRLSAERQREISALLVTLVGTADADADASSVQSSVLGRIEATERRLLDAISAAEIRAARGAAPPVSDTDPAATDG